MVCSATKDKSFNPLTSRIRSVRIEPFIDVAIACRFCEDPLCVASCPRKALRQNEKTGVIVVDEYKCDGCGWCIQACEFGAITLHPSKRTVISCDLCDGKALCVEFCTRKALETLTIDALSAKARKSAIEKLFKSFISLP
jgi:carbon-monoxide dehydrogenase iron sulfur subunit